MTANQSLGPAFRFFAGLLLIVGIIFGAGYAIGLRAARQPEVCACTCEVAAPGGAAVVGTCALCHWKDRAQRVEAEARAQDARDHATLAARNREIANYQGDLARCEEDLEMVHTECGEVEARLMDCQVKCIARFVDCAIAGGIR